MGKITFARVDSRLIHGQIVTKWAKSSGANHIYIIDNVIDQDYFARDIYMASGTNYGFSVKVFSVAKALAEWETNQFGKDKVFIIFKDASTAITCLQEGLPIPILNLGGIPKKKDREFYIKNVALSDAELADFQKLATEKAIEIYAQTVPDAVRKNV